MTTLPIIGFRLWMARSDLVELRSLTEDEPWQPGEVVEADKLPDQGGSYSTPGIHAYYWVGVKASTYKLEDSFTAWHTVSRIYKSLYARPDHHWVAGAIVAWGRTALHEHGFRAQYAKLVSLYYEPGLKDLRRAAAYDDSDGGKVPPRELQAIALRYGVPLCTSHADLVSYASEYGRLVQEKDLVA